MAKFVGAAHPSFNRLFSTPQEPVRRAQVKLLDELVDGVDNVINQVEQWTQSGGPDGGDSVAVPEFGGYDVPTWLASAFASGTPVDQLGNSLSSDAKAAVLKICGYASQIPVIGQYIASLCAYLQQSGQNEVQCPPGQMPYNGSCYDQFASQPCNNGQGYVDPVTGECVSCGPGYRFDPVNKVCAEGCPPEAPVQNARWGCVSTQYNQPCTLGDGSKGVYGPNGDCTPDGCGPGMKYDLDSDSCVPDGSGSIDKKPGPDYCAEFGADYEPVWDGTQWSCGQKCPQNEVRGKDNYCFCRAGYTRQNPNDNTSPCVPIQSGNKTVQCPPETQYDPASGSCVNKTCPEGQEIDKVTGQCVNKDKPSGEKSSGSNVGTYVGIALLVLAGGLVAYGSMHKSPEEAEVEQRVEELKRSGMSEGDARRQAQQELADRKARAGQSSATR